MVSATLENPSGVINCLIKSDTSFEKCQKKMLYLENCGVLIFFLIINEKTGRKKNKDRDPKNLVDILVSI